ncbi:putative nuclease of putative toxin-antitoxin system [Dyadobacter sp. BE34]|uniref:Nuclease of putative toxin-antitoxin system n=1 Tax=Dyadobacter fermentans TaxID=94254 RepID=A0ABU1R2S5_9BACT|nr:putative nuclease of putative toxin-antitoxin system [Dyadobacter fermentans]MDR7045453.1 putative nuclease of putative toxin-antitoxin system [Dyadobacter sp. BE242]MDR7199766.1 putative nuclease of putative toxin-antitoxin system [Dyadobacter sp. BE34]MDR7217775.1 putative nuclease of putative toxin-antitoxin system [Dyadobacter sp. BE31]MDR7265657.1 putative nuclease of putative toxin-antitoxin system [Dyadobacter sp. BE32]
MILADENIDHSLIKAIRSVGFEVHSIYESNRGLSDEAIIEFSRNPPRIILTEDKDFGEWVFAHNISGISVIFLRYAFPETEAISEILIRLLNERSKELFGHFTTITTQKIRSKPFL